jgi:uncharacterized phage protein gp47/JayE
MPKLIRIPTLQQLRDNALSFIQQALNGSAGSVGNNVQTSLQRENNQVLAFAHAAGVEGNYLYLQEHIAKGAIPLYATGDQLADWLESFGLKVKKATPATGHILINDNVVGSVIPDGTEWTNNGVDYISIGSVTVDASGSVSPLVVAAVGGSHTNAAAGAVLSLKSPITGVNSVAQVGPDGLLQGTDDETDDEARFRLIQRLHNPPMGGAPHDYARWALQVSGITRAWGVRTPAGPGSAGVIIMADGNVATNGIPTQADQTAVYDYIRDDERGPPDFDLQVIRPTSSSIDFQIRLSPDTPEIREAVTLEIKDLFFRETEPGKSMPHTHITEAISIAAGEVTHEVVSPALVAGGSFSVGSSQILVLGNVVFVT